MHFSADEVFQMAQQIEKNGAEFYKKAAGVFSDDKNKKLLLDLVKMEEAHLRDFTEMRESFKEDLDIVVDPDDISGAYLSAISNGNVFKVDSDPCEIIKPNSNIIEILKKAIELEKNSIIFYIGLKDLVGSKNSKKKIESIIQQEQRHIVMLNDRMLEEC